MATQDELKRIKKTYGENFMKLCRSLFPTLLDDEGKLYEILRLSFSKNGQTLYEDITQNSLEEEFKDYIYSKVDVEKGEKIIIQNKTPYELLDKAGYDLYECNTEEEIQSFKKYYAPKEELCTFYGKRLNRCAVFFAVKKDIEDIKREDFKEPKREDEYGTSVMGIQFTKQGLCTVSIKNRYNHTVNNPDATYGNDLDKIVYGLGQSFTNLLKERGLEFNKSNIECFDIPGYVVANDGKYYKYNMELNGIYYCPGNIVIENGTAHQLDKNEELIDYFIVDSKNKMVHTYDSAVEDSFVDDLQDLNRIEIINNKENDMRNIIIHKENQKEPVQINVNKNNEIIGYTNLNLEQVGDNFLGDNEDLIQLELPKLKKTGKYFLCSNKILPELELQSLEQVSDNFLFSNECITKLELQNLEQAGNGFLFNNKSITQVILPKFNQAGNDFIYSNEGIKELELQSLEQVGKNFLFSNQSMTKAEFPKLKKTGHNFLIRNMKLSKLVLPELNETGNRFLQWNNEIRQLDLPSLNQVGNRIFAME